MSLILILNQSQVSQGLTTFTYTVPTGGAGVYNVKCQAEVNESLATGFGAGTGADQGLGATGGFPGASQVLQTLSNGMTGLGTAFPNVTANAAPGVNPTTMAESTPNLPSVAPGSGVSGLGFGGAENDNATGTNGHGAGAGGGTLGEFSLGGGGLGDGSVGQGFGPDLSGHNQPLADVHTPTTVAGLASALIILVKQNGSTIFTAPTLSPAQSALQFKAPVVCSDADVITVTLTSANASDKQLNGTRLTVSIGTGQ
jgi:hypothetical protein